MEDKKYDLFISYRRKDVGGYAALFKKELEKHFDVFYDLESINSGEIFPIKLKNAISNSKIILVVIGKDSCDEFKSRLKKNGLDYMANEIKYANQFNKIIIPMLVNDAKMPTKESLPKEISFFNDIQAFNTRLTDLESDLSKLKIHISSLLQNNNVSVIQKNFNNSDKLLNILYPWKKLIDEEKGSIKYQYWACGKEA